jgi:EAL domain-containing protein (putative c-di-GMP-specific phosphodiesterase class I)/signal transduction histidine kinase/ligand-binding sensor domain-containing protein/ActR/RegA family two-component response regulator
MMRYRLPVRSFLLAASLLASFVAAATPATCPRALSQYRVQVWHARDGLPQDAVQAIEQTPDGFIWVGMEDGIARFDGIAFEPIDLGPAVGSASESISALAVGSDGRLHAGTGATGVLVLGPDARPAVAGRAWPRQPVQSLLVQGNQRWAGLRGGGLVDFRGGTARVLGRGSGLAGLGVTALATRRQGGVWIGLGAAGLQWFDGRAFHRLPQVEALGGVHVEDVLEDRAGTLWLATRDGLFRVSGRTVRRYGPQDGLRSDFIRSLMQDRDGYLWVGTTGEGIARLCGDRFEMLGPEHGLPDAPVEQLLQDSEGGIWAAGGGLARLSEGAALPVTVHQGLPASPVLPILQDRRGTLWIGTFSGGLVRWAEDRARVLTRKDGLASDVVLSLARGRGDDLWVGTRDALHLLQGERVVRRYGLAQGLPSSTATALLHDGTRLWIGTVDGLAVLRDGAARANAVPGGSFGANVVALFRDSRGVLWVGTDGAGLFHVRNGVVAPAPFAARLPATAVFSIHETRPGVLWFATGRGLARWDGKRLGVVSARHGLPDDNLMSLLEDGAGNLWAGTNRGVLAVPLDDLERVASTGTGRITSARLFTEADGMPTAETNGGFQPAAWRDANGRHWFGTRSGAAVFDPAALPDRAAVPRVVLRGVSVDARPLALTPDMVVRPDPGVIEIGYVAPSFSQPQRIEYQYRLEGFDDTWYAARGERKAVYRQLPPGRFRFQVRGRIVPGAWSAPAQAGILVQPALVEQWWFRAGAVLLLLVIAGLLLHRRLAVRDARRERLQQVQKLESIGQLTGGIAHDFNNVLAAIVQSCDALAAALPRNHPLQAGTVAIQRAADLGTSLTRQLLAFARREQTEPRWVDLAHEISQMESFLRRLLPAGIRIESHYEPVGMCLIDPVNLQQIVLNLVLNARDAMPDSGRIALRLAQAPRGTTATLPLGGDRGYACFEVEDSGAGMSGAVRARIFEPFFTTKPRGSGTGLGLAVANGIVQGLGGTIAVQSEPGSGTTFSVFLPVEHRAQSAEPVTQVDATRPGSDTRVAHETSSRTEESTPSPGVEEQARNAADRLLILDDNEGVAESLATLVQDMGFAARITLTPADFFREVDRWKPTHVVVDLVMPLMDGVEVLRALGDGGYRGRTVVMSGMGAKVLDAARRSGAAHGLEVGGVLEKPFRAHTVRNVLRKEVAPDRSATPAHDPLDPRLPFEQDLAGAMERGELVQYYQPEVDLLTGTVSGFESLVRWQHPRRGLIFPDQFIPLAERSGQIGELTLHVIRSSLAWLAAMGPDCTLGVSINLSARSLDDPRIFDLLQERCEQLGVDPTRITLELTETSAMLDAVDALDFLTRLRLRGYELAIDDFGTGFSSMMQLARLPFSQLKIDKSFVMSMAESVESRKIVESTISLARALNLVTVAEGVEDAAAMEALRELGCDRAQGYHIARPMDAQAALHWLEREGRTAVAPFGGQAP